jgi:uncharacterized protein YcfJ
MPLVKKLPFKLEINNYSQTMKALFNKFSLLALVAIALPSFGLAETKKAAESTKKTEAKAEEKPKKDTYPLYGQVVSVTTKTLTIKGGEGKEDRKYSITADTEIVDGDKAAKAADVKEGAWVGGLLKKATGSGNDTIVKLNVGVKQKEAKAESKTEAPKKKAE